MRIENIFSKMAWGEREGIVRSADWSVAMAVATVAALLIIFGTSLSYADQSPAKLPTSLDWTQWTEQECDAMLTQSTWESEGAELRSALPLRDALLRKYRLTKHYDRMTPQQKSAFDKKYPPPTNENESDPILLYIQHNSTNEEVNDFDTGPGTLHYNPAPATQVAMKLGDGTLVMPIKTEALENNTDRNRTMYSFPRVINGTSVLTANDRYLEFVLGPSLEGGKRIRPLQDPKKFQVASAWLGPNGISFITDNLMYNGKLEY